MGSAEVLFGSGKLTFIDYRLIKPLLPLDVGIIQLLKVYVQGVTFAMYGLSIGVFARLLDFLRNVCYNGDIRC